MQQTDQKIVDFLDSIKGTGSFFSKHSGAFVFPNFQVEGFGELSYPINEFQAKGLISLARKAPFGKGSETIVDQDVRSAWEVDAEKVHFNDNAWADYVKAAVTIIKEDLGIEEYEVEAHLYKLLVYEKGGFFLTHKDSEKEKGMFGTMIFALPSKHEGGDLIVGFDGDRQIVSFDKDSSAGKIPYVAFYADCDHELKPVESGYRVVLAYNLIQKSAGEPILKESLQHYVEKIASLLKEDEDNASDTPKILLLGHQYTPENFSIDKLKLNDRPKAEVLLNAALAAGYYSNLCLVTSYVVGDGYDEDTEEMNEVIDESIDIEHYVATTNPTLHSISIDEDDLLSSFTINEDDPLEIENSGYMGNYGPEVSYWYHYGAVVLWTKKQHIALLRTQKTECLLHWLEYYNNNYGNLSKTEIGISAGIIKQLELQNSTNLLPGISNAIADWLAKQDDDSIFQTSGIPLLKTYFLTILPPSFEKLKKVFGTPKLVNLIDSLGQTIDNAQLVHLIVIFHELKDSQDFKDVIEANFANIPPFLNHAIQQDTKNIDKINVDILAKLIELESKFPQNSAWMSDLSDNLLKSVKRSYINEELIQTLISRKDISPFSAHLLDKCKAILQARVDQEPQPSPNWTREMPKDLTGYKRSWNILKPFMDSPTQSQYEYKTLQKERNDMEQAIRVSSADLETTTTKKGSPYTLLITKNDKSYLTKHKKWAEDRDFLAKVDAYLK